MYSWFKSEQTAFNFSKSILGLFNFIQKNRKNEAEEQFELLRKLAPREEIFKLTYIPIIAAALGIYPQTRLTKKDPIKFLMKTTKQDIKEFPACK